MDDSCCGVLTLCGLWVGDSRPVVLYSLLKMVIGRAAELYPPQNQKPARKTFKQKSEDKRLDLVAKEITPAADHVSIHMMESLMVNKQLQDNAMDLIEYRILSRYAPLGLVLAHVCAQNAVDADHLQIKKHVRDKSELEVFTTMLEGERQLLHSELERTNRLERELREKTRDEE